MGWDWNPNGESDIAATLAAADKASRAGGLVARLLAACPGLDGLHQI